MGRYIDWYLVELEGCLEGKLRPDRANDLVCQAEAHLVEASDQLRAKGMVEKASELAAIQKFGRAQKIADEATGGRRVSQVFAKLAMFGSFAAFTGLAPLSLLRLGPSDWFVQTYLWICAAVFFIAAMFVKRVPWRELTALGVTAWLALSLWSGRVYPAGSDVNRTLLPGQEQSLTMLLKAVSVESAQFDADRKQFGAHPGHIVDLSENIVVPFDASTDQLPSEPISYADKVVERFILGGDPYDFPAGLNYAKPWRGSPGYPVSVYYDSTKSLLDAKAGWKESVSLAQRLNESRRELESDTAMLKAQIASTSWQSAISHAPSSILVAAIWLAGALLLAFFGTLLPRLTLDRSRVHRQLA